MDETYKGFYNFKNNFINKFIKFRIQQNDNK